MSDNYNEVSPPGWSGSVKAMKKHKEIDNPYALAWHMKNKGDKNHYKPQPDNDSKNPKKPEKYKKYKDEDKGDKKDKPKRKKFTEWLVERERS